MPNFIPLETYFIFRTKFFWNEESILALISNVCYLVIILTFLMVTLVVTARYLVVTIMYPSLTCYLGIYVFPYVFLVAPTYQIHTELAVPREL